MAILPILTVPDPRLKTVAEPVAAVDDAVRQLLEDMLETMYAAPGIGLAAPQVGVTRRITVIDLADKGEDPAPLRVINPKILWASGEHRVYNEGCLSLPDSYADVTRPAQVRVRYLDETGAQRTVEADGLLATCLQHEIDHLNGVLFTDHLSALKRGMILRKMSKLKKSELGS